MNIMSSTTNSLTEAFMHYVCMRMKFRSTVLNNHSGPVAMVDSKEAASASFESCKSPIVKH